MADAMDRFAPGTRRRRGLPPLPGALRAPARRLEPVLLLEAGRGPVRHHRHPRQPQSRRPCATCCPCAWAASVAGTIRSRVKDDAAGADARPLHAVCRLLALRLAGGALRHRPHAGGGGRVVPDGRHARRGRGPGEARRRARRRRSGPDSEVTGLEIENGAVAGVRHRRRRASMPTTRVVSNMDSIRTYRELVGGDVGRALRAQGLRAGLLGRRALSRPRPALRAPRPPRFRVLARSGGGVRLHLPPRRAGARPDLLPRRARRPPTRASRRRAARRSTCSCTRPTCARITTGARCSRPTGR